LNDLWVLKKANSEMPDMSGIYVTLRD